MHAGDGAMDEHGGVEYCARRDGLDDARRGSAAGNDSKSTVDDDGENAAARGGRKREEEGERKAAKKREEENKVDGWSRRDAANCVVANYVVRVVLAHLKKKTQTHSNAWQPPPPPFFFFFMRFFVSKLIFCRWHGPPASAHNASSLPPLSGHRMLSL